MKKFLVIQTAFIGDAILATGVLEKLHRFFPDAQIDFLIRKGNEGLFQDHPFIHKIIIWNKQHGKYRELYKTIKKVRKTKYDRVINLHRFASSGIITRFARASEKVGFEKNPWSGSYTKKFKHVYKDGWHEVDRNNQLLEDITDGSRILPKLYPTPAHEEKTKGLKSDPYCCIAAASVWFTKQFPKEKWVELIQHLNKEQELKIYLLGSKADISLNNDIIQQVRSDHIINLAGQLNLLQSASLMRDAKMNYVNDSAPTHLASAVNAPVTTIYCSTVPKFGFGPLSEKSQIVEINEPLSCRPCGPHGFKKCPEGHFKCACNIDVLSIIG